MKNNIYFDAWKKAFDYEGVVNRRDYWMFFLINFIVACVLGGVSEMVKDIYMLLSTFPMFSITCRRLNDVKKSRFWCVPVFICWLIVGIGAILPPVFKFLCFILVCISGLAAVPTLIVVLIYTLQKSKIENNQ